VNKRLSDSRRNRLEWQRVNLHQFHIIRMSSRPLFGPVRTGSKTPEEISARSLTSTCQTTALHLATKVGQESIWTVGHTEWRIFAPRLTSSKTHARWRSVPSSGRYTPEALVHGLPRPQGGGESGRRSFLPASIEASDIRLHLSCMSALPSLRTFNGLLWPPEDHPNVLHRQGRLPRPC
jgi:hypothetical protein